MATNFVETANSEIVQIAEVESIEDDNSFADTDPKRIGGFEKQTAVK